MARGRMIDKVIILSRKINAISEGAENLYYRIYVNTDDFGLFHADPEILKGQIYTLRKDISVEIIQKRLYELIEIDLIKIYKDNDETYLEIVDFEKHQTFRKDYIRKYDYPKPDTKSYKIVQGRTKSPTNINKIKLNETKLKEEELKSNITDKQSTEIVGELITVKGISLHEAGLLVCYLKVLSIEFPNIDYVEEIKKKCSWWRDHPLNKKSNIHLQLRNWFSLAKKFQKESDKEKRVGESTHLPSEKEDDYDKAREIKMRQIMEIYQPEIDKAMKINNTEWMDKIDNKIKEEIADFSRKHNERRNKCG